MLTVGINLVIHLYLKIKTARHRNICGLLFANLTSYLLPINPLREDEKS